MNKPDPNPDPPPQEPLPPDDDACCGNGCDPCVYDLFHAEQERYREALRAWRERQAHPRGGGPPARDALSA